MRILPNQLSPVLSIVHVLSERSSMLGSHACIINDGKKPRLKVKKDKVVGFHQEVHDLVDIRGSRGWIDKNVGCYFVYDLRYMNGQESGIGPRELYLLYYP